jgi:hypothetical protein
MRFAYQTGERMKTITRRPEPGGGFAAGTLVHTQTGLRPIEQIKAGDFVLSKPKNGGQRTYKRVLKTFAHPPRRVVRVEYEVPTPQNENCAGAWPVGSKTPTGELIRYAAPLLVTFDHPIWTHEKGWISPGHMQKSGTSRADGTKPFHFEDVKGNRVDCWGIRNIYISDQPNAGWTPYFSDVLTDVIGFLWDYAGRKLVDANAKAIESAKYSHDLDTFFQREKEDALGVAVHDLAGRDFGDSGLFFRLPVHDLEVEDFHTYHVGEHGIWVHDQNRDGSRAVGP